MLPLNPNGDVHFGPFFCQPNADRDDYHIFAHITRGLYNFWKVFGIGTVRSNWPMSAHASQAFRIAHCTDSEDLPNFLHKNVHYFVCLIKCRMKRIEWWLYVTFTDYVKVLLACLLSCP